MGRGARIPAGVVAVMLMQCLAVNAADIRIIASPGVASVVNELGREFEAKAGHKIQADYAVIAVSKRKIDAGAAFDLAILDPATIDELITQGKIVAGTQAAFGRTGIGIVVRNGAVRPDIGSADAFKKTMLAAKFVGHSKEGQSGVHFLAALERAGIAAEMKPKLRAYEGAGLSSAIASGEIELGATGIGPALGMRESDYVGPLPAELQSYVVFTAGVSTSAGDAEATKAFLRFMTEPAAAPVFKTRGMERE